MADALVPTNNVTYWIQNVDFGNFLEIINEMPVNRTLNKATFVVRPKKENTQTQEVCDVCHFVIDLNSDFSNISLCSGLFRTQAMHSGRS